MFVINISYTAPVDVVAAHRQPHIEWLQGAVDSGLIAAAGSKTTRDGGVLLSLVQDREYLEAELAKDPYATARVAAHQLTEVNVPMVAGGLEQLKTPAAEDFDVIIVGYGPVGRVLALQLGRRGHRVAVVERQLVSYPLPRAVHFDDEIARVLQSLDASPEQMSHAVEAYDDQYEWRNAAGEPLLQLEWRGGGRSGWNTSYFFHQPSVEAFLHEKVSALGSVTLLRGWETESRQETDDRITLHVRNTEGERRSLTGKYLVGADGANSKIRQWMGTTMTDLGYFHDWLVIDLLPKVPMHIDPPALQICDPLRPTTLVPGGPGRRRFEFLRLDGETKEEFNSEARVWELLKPWGVSPDTAELERRTVYTFQARWCDAWRKGRMLLAGDAAHLMPPFAGQGMSSGLRDAANLEWKLDLVLTGRADESILDSYGPERSEHVRHFIERSMQLGEIICLTDPADAARRDEKMTADIAAGVSMPAHPAPRLGEGLHRYDVPGGSLSIQAVVRGAEREGLFDDVYGSGGTLLLRNAALRNELPAHLRVVLQSTGVRIIAFGQAPAADIAVDSSGAYSRWFDEIVADAVLIRPDFYVYGSAVAGGISELVEDFLTDLQPGKAADTRPVLTGSSR
ncbi:bifunctional 3-(3-hydroxy-phenyl)propionate/3-hydroxycinnamic acid hydroxylase [Pseudarthrobacter sp. N5]|uniref:bifunctional 3-(3-hydroxy-phenyl)propionate/3-hydroxycinnamic acid hydroxylase n=1 Tax=Pseudarthrobacter sp. N5 TaxID=3418416 RepID=UPI003CFABE53